MVDALAPLKPFLDFERAQWTNGSVEDDPFYQAPAYSPQDKRGKVLKLEEVTDTAKYLLPPGVSMSRFIYLSESVRGSAVPVSAYILWPFSPRSQQRSKFPVVAWAYGTSGTGKDAAPSHHRNLWQHFLAPYQIVLNGYVVVATDYAGLGVTKDRSGDPIIHPYLCSADHALDIVLSVQAAQIAFPALSQDFVAVGHSQGGGATWAVAEYQAASSASNCVGCVAISPTTRFLDEREPIVSILTAAVSDGVEAVFPDANIDAFLTPTGQERTTLIRESKAGVRTSLALLFGADLVKPGFRDDPHLQKYAEHCATGGKAIGCPLLIVHGLADPNISAAVSHLAATRTTEAFPAASIAYVGLSGVTHDPAMTAGQSAWMEWIGARFDGKPVPSGFADKTVHAVRPTESYLPETNWYLASASGPWEAP